MSASGSGGSSRAAGKHLEDMTVALLDAAHDKEVSVQNAISGALYELGKKQPQVVLYCCYRYLSQCTKIAQGHRVVILATMERIVKEKISEVDRSLLVDIISEASEELTRSKEVVPDWQTAASGVLVAIGTQYCNEVMDVLLQKFQPGVLPHFFVVQTLGNLASANVFGIVPFLSVVMGTMLPMLTLAKHDNMRWVFSAAFSKFCFAILDYVANLERSPDPTVRKEVFANEINSAYDIFFNVWLQTKETKLRNVIVEALGNMANIMTQAKLEEQLPRILPGILNVYKKQAEPYQITQGLCMILQAATADRSVMLEPQLDSLINLLFSQVCLQPDYTNLQSVRNHNELLRCFAVITQSFSDRIVGYLLQKLEGNNERTRIGTLSIFRHIINSAGSHMENKKSLIVSGLKIVLHETNNKVKKVFAQVIIAMADHGYLRLEGGEMMVEFIIRHCAMEDSAPNRRSADAEYVSNEALRGMCDNILQLISSTIECMHPVLWPHILEFAVQEPYTEAMTSICKCVVNLVEKRHDDEGNEINRETTIDYSENVNVPRECALIARLLVMMGRPLNGRKRGIHVLNAFKLLAPNLHEQIVQMVDTVVPKLVQYLEDALDDEDKWSQKNWEDLLLKMLSKMLDEIDDEDWIKELGDALVQQISLYNKMPEEKNFLYKCTGVVMRKSMKKDFVQSVLEAVVSSVKHQNQDEREGCAFAMGFCGTNHLDMVLSKLENANRAAGNRRSTSSLLGSFMKDSKGAGEADPDKMKATLMLCYGYVALFGSPTLIVSRVEASILRTIDPHFSNAKDDCVRHNLIRSVELIGRALHPKHLQTNHSFTKKNELINHMMSYVKAEPTNHIHDETRKLAFDAMAALVQLDPAQTVAEEDEMIKNCLDSFVPLPLDGISAKKQESYSDIVEKDSLMTSTLNSLTSLMKFVMKKEVSPNHLDNVFKHLSPWLMSVSDHERSRVMSCLFSIMTSYQENMVLGLGGASSLSNAGVLLGRMTPRCTDPDANVRHYGIDCVQTTLKIMQRYEGHDAEYKDAMIQALPTLKERLVKSDATTLYSVITDLSKVFSKKLPSDQLIPFTDTLYDGLLDVQSHSSSAACVVLNTIFKVRGGEFYRDVDRILNTLHGQLANVQFPTTKTGALRAIRILAAHHLLPTLTSLLDFPLPFDDDVNDIWQSLAMDGQLTQNMIDYILDMLSRALPYEEHQEGRDKKKTRKVACAMTLAAVSALCQIFKVEDTTNEVTQNFDKLFSMLLTLIGAMNGAENPKPKVNDTGAKKNEKKSFFQSKKKESTSKDAFLKPSSLVVEAFHQLLTRAGCTAVLDDLDAGECWKKFETEDNFVDAVTVLAETICKNESSHLAYIIANLNPVISGVYDSQRIVVTAFFAELIRQRCSGDMVLIELIMNSMLGRMIDNNYKVRMLCLRGLGNVACVGASQVQKYSTTVLSAMMAGMDDKNDTDDDITLEAMSGLSKILAEIDETNIRAILINIALRIRPCFEKDRAEVRAAAIALFGNLSVFGDGPSRSPYLEQIHTNFVSLLTHLNDPDHDVVKACKITLRKLGPLMGSDDMNSMFQKALLDNANLHYGEFVNDLAKIIIKDFPEKVNFQVMTCVVFFKSCWPEIQCNAAVMAGFLLGNLPPEQHNSISKEHICSALVSLMKDQSPVVRSRAAEAISLLDRF